MREPEVVVALVVAEVRAFFGLRGYGVQAEVRGSVWLRKAVKSAREPCIMVSGKPYHDVLQTALELKLVDIRPEAAVRKILLASLRVLFQARLAMI